jgi:hypothetical protein
MPTGRWIGLKPSGVCDCEPQRGTEKCVCRAASGAARAPETVGREEASVSTGVIFAHLLVMPHYYRRHPDFTCQPFLLIRQSISKELIFGNQLTVPLE